MTVRFRKLKILQQIEQVQERRNKLIGESDPLPPEVNGGSECTECLCLLNFIHFRPRAAMMLASTRVQRTSFSADVRSKAATRVQARSPMVVRASAVAAEDVPTPEKRTIMNLLLAGAVGLPVSI